MNENINDQQQDNQKYITSLEKLLETVRNQQKEEYVAPLERAIELLRGDQDSEDSRGSDDVRLSGDASQMLLQMAEEVRNGTENRANAAARLAFLAGHR